MCMLAGTQDIQAQELIHISRMCKGAHQSYLRTHSHGYIQSPMGVWTHTSRHTLEHVCASSPS